MHPDTKILSAELRWVPISGLLPGQRIISVDEYSPKSRGKARKMRTAIVQKVLTVEREAYKITLDDGRNVVCTGQHPWLSKKAADDCRWRAIEKRDGLIGRIKVGTEIRSITKPWDDSNLEDYWFGGMLDGEGSMIKNNGKSSIGLNVSQRKGEVWERLVKYAKDKGYNPRIESDNSFRKTKYGKTPVPKLCFGRMDEIFKLIGQTRPTRFLQRNFWENRELPGKSRGGKAYAKVEKIEKLGNQIMVDLQTSTGTYIAEGLVSHNTTEESIGCLDDCLFNPNTECLLIAHNLDAGKAIFDKKIELAWKNVRPELRALYKVDANTAQTLKFEFGDGTFSSIAVDTNGRSGTFNRVHITEFADVCKKYPNKVKDILEGTIPAIPTDGRVDIESTSQGSAGEFYEMFMQAWERGKPKYPVEYKAHFYNWQWDEEIEGIVPETDLPEKFKEYQKLNKLTDKEISYYYQKWLSLNKDWNSLHKEYPTTPEEAFEIIIEGSYYGEEIGRMERDGRITVVPHDKALKVHTVWDLGVGSNLRIGFYQRTREGQLRRIDHWFGQGSDGMPEAINAVLKKPYIYGSHWGPYDLESTEISTGKSRRETAKSLGIRFKIVPDVSIEDGINAGQIMLSQLWVDKERNKEWLRSMKNYCREWNEKRGSYKDIPYHNWASHDADEWRYASLIAEKMTNDSQILNRPFYDRTVEIFNEGIQPND